ncbi:dolichyl-P-Glc:Man(9)GlcNAc(2)-PP-dolichol alpha-1,3-glucosyltransferase [Spizellomyces punctatus DAOM BR117]|uniref:Alpha-1,3-glucosyltransferase n=1 Tax=Spizellomyces punctatus (strain DAOM BR117) TaxID=645134 RepID=A0A0L0HGU6_SPIPD|nr:dolichyl-P-Glc:Man(9)GlcNAc(2)-PP-dolichol alpha-1,3-glucosyltransferase [Spizellomyces punctatus DAOM BR117]KND00681.1 hypothetical protein SPPG_03803 [Spizellomyces punctatus DAOM BR117]|eukprot:XP_016608720.1 hypothetical protein SPPG_03803 [Spizellomyces punctatus DAOM BR117]
MISSPGKSPSKSTRSSPPPDLGITSHWYTLLLESKGGHLALFSTYLFTIFIKWCVSLNGYSGQGVPPLYGDFEAQRHWLELTVILPREKWYRYDLQYWGLDYPLITAYHSWVMGIIARCINPEWVALDTSRGYESDGLTVFMRATALVTEYALYVPAVVFFANRWIGYAEFVPKNVLILLILLQPALIIIDHGHFQYNSAMLGFTVWTIMCLIRGKYLLGSIMFCLALNYKQMALFYALPVFWFLLGRCFIEKGGFRLLIKIACTVVATFAIIFALYSTSLPDVLQVFKRVFPVERGLYEDKVANVWCAISVVIKLRQMFDLQTLVYVSILATLLSVLPSGINLFLSPTPKRLVYALLNSSLGFFLFAFQVHEKSILLPLLPATLLLLDEPLWSVWFNNVAMFSMFPLLKRDQLVLPYVLLLLLWNWFASFSIRQASKNAKIVVLLSYMPILLVHTLEATVPPPAKFPDIYTMASVGISTGLFLVFLVYFNYRQFTLSDSSIPSINNKLKRT